MDKGTSLQILLQLSHKQQRFLKISEAKRIVKAYVRFKTSEKTLPETLKFYKVNRPVGFVRVLMIEFRKAGAEGMTLEEYLKKGRPFKVDSSKYNRVLVKKKS